MAKVVITLTEDELMDAIKEVFKDKFEILSSKAIVENRMRLSADIYQPDERYSIFKGVEYEVAMK